MNRNPRTNPEWVRLATLLQGLSQTLGRVAAEVEERQLDGRPALELVKRELVVGGDSVRGERAEAGTGQADLEELRSRVVEVLAGVAATVVDEENPVDAVLKQARIEGEAHRAVLAEEMLTSTVVGRRLGSKAKNPRELARSLRERSELLGVPSRRGHLYPSFQIDGGRQRIHPEVVEVNQLLDAGDDPWGVASWWVSVDGGLGARPMDLVGTPDADRVVAAARALVDAAG